MTPERWQHIEEIFQTALDLAPDERARYVTNACTGDVELRREVETLLTQYEAAGDFIDEPVYERSGVQSLAALMNDEGDPLLGQRMGAYAIEREIGRGGMGTVYLASRADNVFQKRVAIKVVKRGMDTDYILRRFRHERQILATLDHANITRLLDGGATDDGRPYFVMEYVEGEPLYHYCDTRRLGVRERLRLFVQVCDAVEYAHQNKVIHRDIKPSNILINPAGVPKLFDFGIAKLLNPEIVSDSAPQTATAMRLMTIEYASPEQVQGWPVTHLSDIYSLGVLLYELLTGHRPYHFRSRLLHEMARVISEEEPVYPSAAVNRSDNFLPVVYVDQEAITIGHLCEMRNETPDTLRRELSGGLDNITLKALRKEPAARYQSAGELREDLRRYLEGRPVAAPLYIPTLPAHAAQRAGGRADELAIAVLPFKLIGTRQPDDTDDEYLSVGLADALITRLSNVRRISVRPTSSIVRCCREDLDPFEAGRELGVGFVLDGRIQRAGERVRVTVQLINILDRNPVWAQSFDEQFTDVLSIQDSISEQVAEVLVPQLTRDERRQLAKRGTNSPEAFESYMRGRHHWHSLTEEGFARAIRDYQRAIKLDPNYALAYASLADYYIFLGIYGVMSFAESTTLAKQAAQKAIELDGTLAEGYAALGFAMASGEFDWAAAEEQYRTAIRLNPNSATAHNWYAFLLMQEARFDEAFAELERTRELDPVSPLVSLSFAWCCYHSGRFDEAIAVYRKVIEAAPDFPYGRLVYSWTLRCAGLHEEAVAQTLRAVEIAGPVHLYLTGLGAAYAGAGRTNETRAVLNQLLEMSRTQYVSPYLLAVIYTYLGETEQALSLLEEAVAIGDAWANWLVVDPQLNSLRAAPRFEEIMRRSKNPGAPRRAAAPPITGSGERTIAVLPFKMLSVTAEESTGDRFLGVGLTDALITRLSNMRRLVVRPTSSVLRYIKDQYDPFAAGVELGVGFVLDGHIRRASDRLRLSVQLMDVGKRVTVWAATFDEKTTDVFALEDIISTKVAEALIPQLSSDEREQLAKRGTDDPDAFEAYMRGRYYWNTMTADGFAKALACFQNAIAIDPTYAAPYAGIAEYHCWLAVYGLMPPAACLAEARAAAGRAIELDDELADAHTAYGLALLAHEKQWTAAGERFRRALELNPNYAPAHAHYACQLAMEGRFEESIAEARRACEVDPLNPFSSYFLAWCLYQARRYDEGIAQCRLLLESEPLYGSARFAMSLMLRETGHEDEAVEEAKKTIELMGGLPLFQAALGAAYAEAGDEVEARRILNGLHAEAANSFISPYHRALIHIQLGESEEALRLLAKSVKASEPWIAWLGVEPQLDSLRGDPRFQALLRQTGNPAAGRDLATDGSEKSVAVLPFKLLGTRTSNDTGEEYLGVGLADSLITRLSNVCRLNMRPTSAILRYGNDTDPLAAGRELGTGFVLEGRLKFSGTRIRISLQLLRVLDGASVWAYRFDEQFTDVLTLEDAISEQVAAALALQLTGEQPRRQIKKRGTDNTEAFEAYLRGRYYWNTFTEEGFAKALLCFNRAVAIAPDYALAYTGIADYYNFLGIYSVLPFAETSASAKEAALKAVALDGELPNGYSTLGFATLTHDFDWKAAEDYFLRALELDPNYAVGRSWYCYFLGMSGRFDEAFAQAALALDLDPLTPIIRHALNWTYYYARRYEDSIAAVRKLIKSEPQYGMAYIFLCLVLSRSGDHEGAVQAGQKVFTLLGRTPYTLGWLASAHALAGEHEEARKLLDEIAQLSDKRYVSPYLLAMVYVNLGETERAMCELEHALEMRDGRLVWLGVEPQFDPLRDDPRFETLLRQTNNPAIGRKLER